jgi:hypothetical protein
MVALIRSRRGSPPVRLGLGVQGRLTVGQRHYLLNRAGAGGLPVNGAVDQAWPSTALNVVWLGIGRAVLHAMEPARTPPAPTSAYRGSGDDEPGPVGAMGARQPRRG